MTPTAWRRVCWRWASAADRHPAAAVRRRLAEREGQPLLDGHPCLAHWSRFRREPEPVTPTHTPADCGAGILPPPAAPVLHEDHDPAVHFIAAVACRAPGVGWGQAQAPASPVPAPAVQPPAETTAPPCRHWRGNRRRCSRSAPPTRPSTRAKEAGTPAWSPTPAATSGGWTCRWSAAGSPACWD